MLWGIKKLNDTEHAICHKTLSPKATFAIIGHAIASREGLSVVRMGDGEAALLDAEDGKPFTRFDERHPDLRERLGIEGLPVEDVKKRIVAAANECTYFAPSVSGISYMHYRLHDRVTPRDVYFDNFFVNDWSKRMIRILLEASDGVFVIHRDYERLIEKFVKHYDLPREHFGGFAKKSWRDNDEAVQAAVESGAQLILFSAGPAGKVIGPALEMHGKVAINVGNTLPSWSTGEPERER